jgi:hypothetical protein
MNKILLSLLLIVNLAFAERVDKGIEVCLVAHIVVVDGKKIPQRGVRVFQQRDGTFYGDVIKNGYDQYEFDGDSSFSKAMASALAELPADIRDWNAYIDDALGRAAQKTGTLFGVLDGWTAEIRVATPTVKIDLVRENAGAYVLLLGDLDPKISKLKRLLDTIALGLGRDHMAL